MARRIVKCFLAWAFFPCMIIIWFAVWPLGMLAAWLQEEDLKLVWEARPGRSWVKRAFFLKEER